MAQPTLGEQPVHNELSARFHITGQQSLCCDSTPNMMAMHRHQGHIQTKHRQYEGLLLLHATVYRCVPTVTCALATCRYETRANTNIENAGVLRQSTVLYAQLTMCTMVTTHEEVRRFGTTSVLKDRRSPTQVKVVLTFRHRGIPSYASNFDTV